MKKIIVVVALLMGCCVCTTSNKISLPAFAEKASETMSMESCEEVCKKCQKVCENTLAYCEKKGGKHADAKHLDLLKDCITACKTSADFLSRKSDNHTKSCAFCAEICKLCALSCESFEDDKQMKECGAECRRCESSCAKMAEMK